jgi:hypothetical protein
MLSSDTKLNSTAATGALASLAFRHPVNVRAALNSGALPALLATLALPSRDAPSDAMSSPTSSSLPHDTPAGLLAREKALSCIGSIIAHNPVACNALSLCGGLAVIARHLTYPASATCPPLVAELQRVVTYAAAVHNGSFM